jgi:hypothetical protein
MRWEPDAPLRLPPFLIDVVETNGGARPDAIRCEIGKELSFSLEPLKKYFLAEWDGLVFDALLLAAAVEFCDRSGKRPRYGWGRDFDLRLPVHDPDRWSDPVVTETLHEALSFLTGDRWRVSFVARRASIPAPRQRPLSLLRDDYVVIPFSDGLDSRAVAQLEEKKLGDRLIRVRVGSNTRDHRLQIKASRKRPRFTSIPYRVRPVGRDFKESSGRSRGFKFFMVSGLAAYLLGSKRIIIPESGQGALGPWLIPVGYTPADYRNHPLFARRMEIFLAALLKHQLSYEFPRLWFTKGETLREYVENCGAEAAWQTTRSCWQQNRQVSVNGEKRHCGVCAACMLRRMSIHAAGLEDIQSTYVWEKLSAPDFTQGVADGFHQISRAQREYAIAGALHLHHLAALRDSPSGRHSLGAKALHLGKALGEPMTSVDTKLRRLLSQHEAEWNNFMADLGEDSFVADWVSRER